MSSPLRNLDLNLLPTLDALLRERNVTRAAQSLGLSQPAVSSALRRLRRHFGDELLHRAGNAYELTPLAVQLRPQTVAALASVSRVFESSPAFDPAGAEREFSLIGSDYATTVLGELLCRRLAATAPGIRLRIRQPSATLLDDVAETLRSVDGLLLPHGLIANLPYDDLYDDTWVCIVSKDNPEVGEQLDLDLLARLPWVTLFDLPTAFAPAARQLAMIGVEPKVDIAVDSFLPMPFLVAGSRRVAVVQKRLAERLEEVAGVRVLPCPWEVVPLKEALWWHPVHAADPAHQWLRELVVDVARELREEPAAPA